MSEKYIFEEDDSFIIKREIKNNLIIFGSYSTLEEAIIARDELDDDGWPLPKNEIKVEKEVSCGQYITKKDKKFVVSREIGGVKVNFGVFDTLENAKAFKYRLIENSWSVNFPRKPFKIGKFINKQGNNYVISRDINGKFKKFGIYKSIDETLLARDKLISNNWGEDKSLILKNLEIEELSGNNHHIGKAGRLFVVYNLNNGIYTFYGFFRNISRAIKRRDKLTHLFKKESKNRENLKDIEYVTKSKNHYRISRLINGSRNYYGHYDTLEEAIEVRNLLIDYDWDYNFLINSKLIKKPQVCKYIFKVPEGYEIIRAIGGYSEGFGVFDNLGEAIDARNNLEINNWDINSINKEYNETKYEPFIFLKEEGNYYIKKEIDGVNRIFGVFNNSLDAISARYECIKNNWDFESVTEEEYFNNPTKEFKFEVSEVPTDIFIEDSDNISFPVMVRNSYENHKFKLNRNYIKELLPVLPFELNCKFLVNGTEVEGKFRIKARLFYKDNEELSNYLEKLFKIDPATLVRINLTLNHGKYIFENKIVEFKYPFNDKFKEGYIKVPRSAFDQVLPSLPYESACTFTIGDMDVIGYLQLKFRISFSDYSVIMFLEDCEEKEELDIKLLLD